MVEEYKVNFNLKDLIENKLGAESMTYKELSAIIKKIGDNLAGLKDGPINDAFGTFGGRTVKLRYLNKPPFVYFEVIDMYQKGGHKEEINHNYEIE